MTHSDNNGLVLPPAVAPVQVVVVPIAQHKPGVLDAANALKSRLEALDLRVKLDDSEQSPGWKFAQYEMKGVPLRVEIGPKDMEKQQCCIARRDTGEKTFFMRWLPVLTLTLCTFVFNTSEFIPIGLLTDIGLSLIHI